LNQYNGNAASDWLANTPYIKFNAFSTNFIGGATVGAGDMNGDGRSEILVGSGTGVTASVNVYDPNTLPKNPVVATNLPATFARYTNFFPATFLGGVASISIGKSNADATPDVFVTQGNGGTALVVNIDGTSGKNGASTKIIYAFSAYVAASRNYASTTAVVRDIDGDGFIDYVFTAQASDGATRGVVRSFRIFSGQAIDHPFFPGINNLSLAGYSIG
jgi:hypothetical protein